MLNKLKNILKVIFFVSIGIFIASLIFNFYFPQLSSFILNYKILFAVMSITGVLYLLSILESRLEQESKREYKLLPIILGIISLLSLAILIISNLQSIKDRFDDVGFFYTLQIWGFTVTFFCLFFSILIRRNKKNIQLKLDEKYTKLLLALTIALFI